MVQGKNDPRVPYTEAEQIVREARASGARVWYLLAENEGHGFARKENADFLFYSVVHVHAGDAAALAAGIGRASDRGGGARCSAHVPRSEAEASALLLYFAPQRAPPPRSFDCRTLARSPSLWMVERTDRRGRRAADGAK